MTNKFCNQLVKKEKTNHKVHYVYLYGLSVKSDFNWLTHFLDIRLRHSSERWWCADSPAQGRIFQCWGGTDWNFSTLTESLLNAANKPGASVFAGLGAGADFSVAGAGLDLDFCVLPTYRKWKKILNHPFFYMYISLFSSVHLSTYITPSLHYFGDQKQTLYYLKIKNRIKTYRIHRKIINYGQFFFFI